MTAMDGSDWLADRFEEQRIRLRAMAYRMLGSIAEADDAVQETWLRLSRADTSGVDNLAGWLTTVTARVCLNLLRARGKRAEEPLETHVPDPIVSLPDAPDPEQEALLADSVGLALHIVLESLAPGESEQEHRAQYRAHLGDRARETTAAVLAEQAPLTARPAGSAPRARP